GALNPEELWQNIVAGKNLVSDADPDSWGKNISEFLEPASGKTIPADKAWHSRGGHVHGFESVFDGSKFDFDQESLKTLDPLFQWVLHTGLTALTEAQQKKKSKKTGVIIGNLSYPTRGMNEFAQAVWCKDLKAHAKANALNKYMSGFPAHLLSTSLGLSGPAYCIDAACASSLYAIKLACDELNHGNVDLMLAGGVNAIDDLFLHVGFTSLGALSKSGQSRPFHREADGLIPATGAAMIALKRLSDAEADGDKILGVIRGVGLSNDGSAGGLLSPSVDAQTIAMEKAYAMSGLSPKDISLIECHATGTQVGDGIELESLGNLYKDQKNISIGSLKSNMGHLVTAAGVAGVIKMLAA
ncbi:MAG: polyketide synthase, partial [Desulfuromonadales bacterium]|nr:polyketide synthase [Desulfuromonadales bacterium]